MPEDLSDSPDDTDKDQQCAGNDQEEKPSTPADQDRRGMYRMGAISAFIVFAGYLAIIALFIPVVPVPEGGQEMLEYLDGKTSVWWAIVGVSFLTEIPYAIVGFALFEALKGINRNAMLLALGFISLFVVLELAITWPNYANLIMLSEDYAAATTETERVAIIGAANYAAGMLRAEFLGFYTILFPALGSLLIGLVLLKGFFGKAIAYLALVTGLLGVVSVVGPLFSSAFDSTIILTSTLSMIWFLMVGVKLYKLGGV